MLSRDSIFERQIDMQGRLRLPDRIKDEYGRCVLFLGFGLYLHLTTEAIWLEFDKASTIKDILSEEETDRWVRIHQNKVHLTQDSQGRIAIPIWLLKRVEIEPGDEIVGENVGKYWRLTSKDEWLKNNAAGQSALSAYREHFPNE